MLEQAEIHRMLVDEVLRTDDRITTVLLRSSR
jgi:hypothetical protein